MVCMSQHHPAFCHLSGRAECCTKCTVGTKFHNCTFWDFERSVGLRRKQIFSVHCRLHKQEPAVTQGLLSKCLNGGIVKNSWCQPRVWTGTMSHCASLWAAWTLCKHSLIFTGPGHWSWSPLPLSCSHDPGLSDSPGGVNYWPGVTQLDSLSPGVGWIIPECGVSREMGIMSYQAGTIIRPLPSPAPHLSRVIKTLKFQWRQVWHSQTPLAGSGKAGYSLSQCYNSFCWTFQHFSFSCLTLAKLSCKSCPGEVNWSPWISPGLVSPSFPLNLNSSKT